MYPANLFALFPPFPHEDKVFVAMSFDPAFELRWRDVIAPAIRDIKVNDVSLEPHRVDVRKVSDSILTEILTGVSRYRVVLGDITSTGKVGTKAIRNSNVMYEIGIAHAVRLPEEVVLFRSDSDDLLFDLANIRVNTYDPDGAPDAAKEQVRDVIIETLREIDLKRHFAVRRAAEALDYPSWNLLTQAFASDGVKHPAMRTMGQILSNTARALAIARLLDLGALSTKYLQITPEILKGMAEAPEEELLRYTITPFGKAVIEEGMNRMGLFSPEMQEVLEQAASDGTNQPQEPA